MAHKTDLIGHCPLHGDYFKDVDDSPCPSCEESELSFEPEEKDKT